MLMTFSSRFTCKLYKSTLKVERTTTTSHLRDERTTTSRWWLRGRCCVETRAELCVDPFVSQEDDNDVPLVSREDNCDDAAHHGQSV